MNNIECIKKSIEYIENNLTQDIRLKDIARSVNMSDYHFHRMFTSITGTSLKEYIRKRRLYLAAKEIIDSKEALINIAQKYQFSSQSSFTVAFNHMHGVTPGALRKAKLDYNVYGRMIVNCEKRERPLGLIGEPSLVQVDTFEVIGYRCLVEKTRLKYEDNPIAKMWQNYLDMVMSYVQKISEEDLFVIYDYDPVAIFDEDASYHYTLGCKCRDEGLKGMVRTKILEGYYLKFQVDLQKTNHTDIFNYIDMHFIPNSDYVLSKDPDYELRPCLSNLNIVDIYISVENK